MRAKQRNDSFYQNFALCFGVHPRLGEVSKEMLEDKMVILEKSHLGKVKNLSVQRSHV